METIDWIIVGAFLAITLFIGIRVRSTASKSLSAFFLGGRNLPWYIAGVSMVATTFAADTPLWVAEVVADGGIARNWIWWNWAIGGILTTFFFAHLWRRANILTELEFLELRYSGGVAKFLRGFKSIYLGLFLNCVIIGWVNVAMVTILHIFFNMDKDEALIWTFAMMGLVAIYSSMSGLLGVAITDFVQFIIAMVGSVILAAIVLNSDDIGGISGLIEKSEAWRLDFFPKITTGTDGGSITQYTLMATITLLSVTWWATWFPGNEPGGGGYISQRMMSAKTEKDAVFSSLFFQIAHYALRPWPWIIVGLCAVILYPGLEKPQEGYVLVMNDYLPSGLKGLLLAAFIGAYMSTISTQLNWGASYITNDLYKRFIKPPETLGGRDENRHYVMAARLITVGIMMFSILSTSIIGSIDEAVHFILAASSGLGAVLILRWYWYRINAVTELVATLAPIVGYSLSLLWVDSMYHWNAKEYTTNEGPLLFTAGFTTICWLVSLLFTKPESEEVLVKFYERVRPGGWWGPIAKKSTVKSTQKMGPLFLCWISAIALIYSTLFLIGKIIFMETNGILVCSIIAFVSIFVLHFSLRKSGILRSVEEPLT